jgi:hypothetical protein
VFRVLHFLALWALCLNRGITYCIVTELSIAQRLNFLS